MILLFFVFNGCINQSCLIDKQKEPYSCNQVFINFYTMQRTKYGKQCNGNVDNQNQIIFHNLAFFFEIQKQETEMIAKMAMMTISLWLMGNLT